MTQRLIGRAITGAWRSRGGQAHGPPLQPVSLVGAEPGADRRHQIENGVTLDLARADDIPRGDEPALGPMVTCPARGKPALGRPAKLPVPLRPDAARFNRRDLTPL